MSILMGPLSLQRDARVDRCELALRRCYSICTCLPNVLSASQRSFMCSSSEYRTEERRKNKALPIVKEYHLSIRRLAETVPQYVVRSYKHMVSYHELRCLEDLRRLLLSNRPTTFGSLGNLSTNRWPQSRLIQRRQSH